MEVGNYTDSDSFPKKEILEFILNFFLMYIDPLAIILGLIGNLLIMVAMPRTSMTASKSAKFYYILIAFADFFDIIVGWMFRNFLGQSVAFYTNDAFKIDLYRVSTITCKIMYSGWMIFETISNYTTVAMGIERAIAIWYEATLNSCFITHHIQVGNYFKDL